MAAGELFAHDIQREIERACEAAGAKDVRELQKAVQSAYEAAGAKMNELQKSIKAAYESSGDADKLQKAVQSAYESSGIKEVHELQKAVQSAYESSGIKEVHELAMRGFVADDKERIARLIVGRFSRIPYVRSISYTQGHDGWTLLVKQDHDSMGEAMKRIIGETIDLDRTEKVPCLDTHVFHVSEDISDMGGITIFER